MTKDDFVKVKGEGLSSCSSCDEKGIWNRHWTCMLKRYTLNGKLYCDTCIDELIADKERGEMI